MKPFIPLDLVAKTKRLEHRCQSLLGRDTRRRPASKLGLLAMLIASLSSCSFSQSIEERESPPPKEPNCPLTDLGALRSVDGTLADVRIIQVHHTKLYIPTSWLKASWLLVDFEKAEYDKRKHLLSDTGSSVWTLRRDYHREFTPDAHLHECPGTVHVTSDDISGYNGIRLQFHRRDGIRVDASNVSSASVVKDIYLTHAGGGEAGTAASSAARIDWWPREIAKSRAVGDGWRVINATTYFDERVPSDDLNAWFIVYQEHVPWGTSAEQWVLPSVMFRYEAPIRRDDMNQWRELRAPMRELANWLATPPSDRNNKQVFTLGPVNR